MSPAVVLGVALLVLYWAWIGFFFARVRPWVMNALARRLGVKVEESANPLDAGTYSITGRDAPWRKGGVVAIVDLVVLLLGTAGVAALLFVPVFIVADRGALLPIEQKLTGRGATIEAAAPADMARATGETSLAVRAINAGSQTLASCAIEVEGYAAANGYLHGRSPSFDLPASQERKAVVPLSATSPPAGEHRFRVKLECANERIAVADAALVVR